MLNASLRGSEAKAVLFQGPFQRFSNLWASDLPAALQVRVHAPAFIHGICFSLSSCDGACSDDELGPCPCKLRVRHKSSDRPACRLATLLFWLATAVSSAAWGSLGLRAACLGAGVLGARGRCTTGWHPRGACPGQV